MSVLWLLIVIGAIVAISGQKQKKQTAQRSPFSSQDGKKPLDEKKTQPEDDFCRQAADMESTVQTHFDLPRGPMAARPAGAPGGQNKADFDRSGDFVTVFDAGFEKKQAQDFRSGFKSRPAFIVHLDGEGEDPCHAYMLDAPLHDEQETGGEGAFPAATAGNEWVRGVVMSEILTRPAERARRRRERRIS